MKSKSRITKLMRNSQTVACLLAVMNAQVLFAAQDPFAHKIAGSFLEPYAHIKQPDGTYAPGTQADRELERFQNRVFDDWSPSKTEFKGATVTASVGANSRMYDVKVEVSSGDAQVDADCLQAVMGASESCELNVSEGELQKIQIHFGSTTRVGHRSGISKYFEYHPEAHLKYIAFYRIPLHVLKKWPGLFTENELLDESNIGLIIANDEVPESTPSYWTVVRLKSIYQGVWIPFFRSVQRPNKEKVLKLRDSFADDRQKSPAKSQIHID